jgi:hypothetical protein
MLPEIAAFVSIAYASRMPSELSVEIPYASMMPSELSVEISYVLTHCHLK